jgi:hypothetical protein
MTAFKRLYWFESLYGGGVGFHSLNAGLSYAGQVIETSKMLVLLEAVPELYDTFSVGTADQPDIILDHFTFEYFVLGQPRSAGGGELALITSASPWGISIWDNPFTGGSIEVRFGSWRL